MRVLLSGGATAGPVTPLLAVVGEIRATKPETEFLWLGTYKGPEKVLVEGENIKFQAISSGKLRRYFSWDNFFDHFRQVWGFFQALKIVHDYKPDVILSAGGYVSVPVIWAGWLQGVPSIVHQQDYQPILSVKMVQPFVKLITVSFPDTVKFFPVGKAKWVGHPVRQFFFDAKKDVAKKFFHLDPNLPTLLITGGGTGALSLNEICYRALPEILQFCQVIHLTGSGKAVKQNLPPDLASRYHQFEFLNQEMAMAYAASDVVVSRAGASAAFELASLAKPVIFVPLPNSPQEKNAAVFQNNKAAIVLGQKYLTPQQLSSQVNKLISDPASRSELSRNISALNPPDAAKRFVQEIWQLKK